MLCAGCIGTCACGAAYLAAYLVSMSDKHKSNGNMPLCPLGLCISWSQNLLALPPPPAALCVSIPLGHLHFSCRMTSPASPPTLLPAVLKGEINTGENTNNKGAEAHMGRSVTEEASRCLNLPIPSLEDVEMGQF